MKDISEELDRAEAIALVESGGSRGVLERIAAMDESGAFLAEWKYIKGLAYAYLGLTADAAAIWEALLADDLWSEKLVAELSRAYLTLSRPQDAEALIDSWQAETASSLSAELEEVWAESLLAQQDATKAGKIVSRVTADDKSRRNIGSAAITRARVLCSDWEALAALDDKLSPGNQVDPGDREGHALQAVVEMLRRNSAFSEAALVLEHLICDEQASVEVWTNLAQVKWQLGDENTAMNLLADAHEKYADSEVLLEAIARVCLEDRSYELAGAWVTQLEEKLGSGDHNVKALAAEVMLGLGDLHAVQELIGTTGEEDDGLDSARVAFYSRINVPDRAIYYQDKLVAAGKRAPDTLMARARLASGAGYPEDAVQLAQELLATSPNSLNASALLVAHQGRDAELTHLQRLRNALFRAQLPKRQQAWLSHCLAEYHHATADFDIAAQLYDRCNRLSEPAIDQRYNREVHSSWLQQVTAAFAAFEPPAAAVDVSKGAKEQGGIAAQPVFVVGVPRSGTTLTEQILARHPQVTGMGECHHASVSQSWLRQPDSGSPHPLPLAEALSQCSQEKLDALRERFLALLEPHAGPELAQTGHYFVDKMPDNYSQIGWILTLFPNARIIYARRDPREIALSCWKANFGAINWAYRIEDIAHRIVQHHKIMKFWLEKFADRIYVSDYAELVSQPEQKTREMLAFIGLEWDEACGDHTRAASVVRTASVNQVRKPVYKTSLKGWLSYEEAMAPAIAAFEHHELL